MRSCVTELTCITCGSSFPGVNLATAEGTWTVCPRCGPLDGVLDVGYDLDRVCESWKQHPLANRPATQWRYAELLPLETASIRYDWPVGCTPILDSPRLARHLNLRQVVFKDEGRNPTCSFKDRASSVGVAHALQVGASAIACASTGNAASSLAGHAALAGLPAFIFVPHTAPEPKIAQLQVFGATVFAVRAAYDDVYDLCTRSCQEFGWYNRNCAMNPILVEGKKTAGLEIAEQSADCGGVMDWVAVSVGDGCTVAGIWKGLRTMHELGVVERVPRLLAVQAAEVAPIAHALRSNELSSSTGGGTIADSINVHVPRNWRKAVSAIREAKGELVTVTDAAILDAMRLAGRHGMFAEPAAAAALAGVVAASESKIISSHERVLIMITGSGLKDTRSAIHAAGRPNEIEPSVCAVAQALEEAHRSAGVRSP